MPHSMTLPRIDTPHTSECFASPTKHHQVAHAPPPPKMDVAVQDLLGVLGARPLKETDPQVFQAFHGLGLGRTVS